MLHATRAAVRARASITVVTAAGAEPHAEDGLRELRDMATVVLEEVPHTLVFEHDEQAGRRRLNCEGYPDCDQTYGIPQRGELIRLEENCSICGETPRLKVWTGRRPWNLCLNEECPSMVEMRAQRAEREAARAAKEAAAAAAADGEGTADDAGAEGDAAEDAKKPAKPAPAKRRRSPGPSPARRLARVEVQLRD